MKFIREYAFIPITIIAAILVNTFIIVNARIPSASMENTISVGDRLFGNRLAYISSAPQRYDIVIFKAPDKKNTLYIKRIIGLPGETITVKDGIPYINGEIDPNGTKYAYTNGDIDGDGVFKIPEDCYFVMGDNRAESLDARYWNQHYITRKDIVAKAVLRYWPLNKIKVLS